MHSILVVELELSAEGTVVIKKSYLSDEGNVEEEGGVKCQRVSLLV